MKTTEHDHAERLAAHVLDCCSDPDSDICVLARQFDRANERAEKVRVALEESVKLQSHYAEILNQYDGGERMTFPNADAWIMRLMSTNTI